MKLKIKLVPHSIVDIITNSSSAIFCLIESTTHGELICEILKDAIKRDIQFEDCIYEDNFSLSFSIEYGNNEETTDDFCNMIEYILKDKVGKENYTLTKNPPQ